ncbi:MAG: hypothetical protein ACYDBB_22970 [Armatimonadota bacterium]
MNHRFLYVGGWGGQEIRYTWSALLPLCSLEELFAPEMTRKGLRFGNPHLPEDTHWTGFHYASRRMDATAGPNCTSVECDQWAFHAEPGVVVREFVQDEGIRFSVKAGAETSITLRSGMIGLGSKVLVDGEMIAGKVDGDTVTFTVPGGELAVEIR